MGQAGPENGRLGLRRGGASGLGHSQPSLAAEEPEERRSERLAGCPFPAGLRGADPSPSLPVLDLEPSPERSEGRRVVRADGGDGVPGRWADGGTNVRLEFELQDVAPQHAVSVQ